MTARPQTTPSFPLPPPPPADKLFQNTGLERTKPLEKDLAWFQQHYGIATPQVGRGRRAASLVPAAGWR
jgi:hypothetical protein